MIDPAARARLEWWKLSLLDLTTENPLLDARTDAADPGRRTCIAIPDVDPGKLATALGEGNAFAFAPGEPVADQLELRQLRVPLASPELERRLVTLRRTARAELADHGVHTLWLALGILVWCDSNQASHAAPLVLWPVELERNEGGVLRLVAAEGVEPRFNHTLGEKLRRDFDILLAPAEGEMLDATGLGVLLEAADGIAVTRPGWRVERSVRLGVFSFARFAMWQDLDARGDALLASPVVAHLASDAGIAFAQPSAAAAGAVTAPIGANASAWASSLLAPLDADARQLHAVAAAAAGASFVLQGAPGTGKSQTIANLIVHLMGQGKSVLFVSHKIAALEVVKRRLAAVGLGEICLELHTQDSARAQVLAQLGRVLERAFRPGAGPGGDDRLAELRAALDGHVTALHRIGPFRRSLHDVLGRLVELRATPRAALAERDAVGLDGATFEQRRIAVEQLAAAARAVEPVANHPWRTSTLERWPLDGRERALAAIDEAAEAAATLGAAVGEVASLVPGLVTRTRDQLQALGALAALAATSPRPGAELLTQLKGGRGDDIGEQIALIRARGGGTIEVPRDPLAFLTLASRHRALAIEVDDRFTSAVSDLDAAALWGQLRKWTNSVAPVRFVALRTARAAVKAVAMPLQLETDPAMITALESVIAERACRVALEAAAEPARRWFGELGGDPLALELAKIDAAVGWSSELRRAFDAVDVIGGDAGRNAAWRALVAQVAAGPGPSAGGDLATAFGRLAVAVARWVPSLAGLAEATGIDRAQLGAGDDHLVALRERTETLRHSIDSLRDWVAFHGARHQALTCGIGPAVAAIEQGDIGASELGPAWERATLLAWADAELADTPALARFHGSAHHAHVAAFADLDRAALALVRSRALVRLAERVPRVTASRESSPDLGGEVGVLLQELGRSAPRAGRPRSVRELFAEIPTLLSKVAPCMLMSPLAVAEYLDPAIARFDVVVFDEASQLATSDAIGALSRGEAAVIVGDSRQLPPTRSFEATAATDGAGLLELDSVLDDCLAARIPELQLAWHYRSRHEDLIAFANERYYADRLQVFPTAHSSPDLGVSWRRVEGACDPDEPRVNRNEAEAVVAEVLNRLRGQASRVGPRSIAVITCSRAQQALIEDLLDAARDADPALDAFFEADGELEPVIVKDLETVQGDERDVVLLSIGHGPAQADAPETMTMDLGPLSRPGGERRLNVAITRAREQLIVFSSFAPEDIAEDAVPALRDLAALLAFARRGGGAARPESEAPAASPITAAIARALGDRGWTLRHQVGCGAYKVDLAVVDPNDPDRYVLAIEHDGTAYASAPAARDRDRLRSQVLTQLGWRLHRVWSLDWWADPEREIQRAHGAIVTAIAASRQRRTSMVPRPMVVTPASGRLARPSGQPRTVAAGTGAVARLPSRPPSDHSASFDAPVQVIDSATRPTLAAGSSPVRIPRNSILIGPYTAAAIPSGRRTPDDLFSLRHVAELGKVVEQILAAEAPIHVELLARRVGAYFGIGRVTQRVTDQVRVALEGRGRWGDEQDVVWRLDQDPGAMPPVRVAGAVTTALREIEQVPLSELAAAARIVVERATGISANDLVRDAARLLGFARITADITDRVALGVRLAQVRELIKIDSGRATLPAD